MSSSTQVPRMRPCPQCALDGVVVSDGHMRTCPLCNGDKYVTHFRAAQWELEQGRALDSSQPPPAHDPNKLPDTEPES